MDYVPNGFKFSFDTSPAGSCDLHHNENDPQPRKFSQKKSRHLNYHYAYPTDSEDDDNVMSKSSGENHQQGEISLHQNEADRLASLEALRYALYHAPFCRNRHTLMSVPNEESYAMIGIPTKCAVRCEQLCYRNILEDVNIDVPKGKIYAILGSANNGKSALLKCILGRLKPTAGSVITFSTKPAPNSLSGICVGYMPQAVSLHRELTIGQTLHYYCRLYQMPLGFCESRIRELNQIFRLPDQNHRIGNLNASQLWKMSLAISLIHSPPLLLLDEPTVNVDPLVRSELWSHLEELSQEEGLTIVFTTKLPEEIRFAYKVALMRDGHVFTEDQPENLRKQYDCLTYDEMYIKFCESNVPRRIRLSIAPYINTFQPDRLSRQTSNVATTHHFDEHEKSSTSTTNTPPLLSLLQENKNIVTDQNNNFELELEPSEKNCDENKIDSFYGIDTSSVGSYVKPQIDYINANARSLPMAEWPIAERRRTAYISRFINLDLKRLVALILKNLFVIQGNSIAILIFYFIFPALQIIMGCLVFGQVITNLPVSVLVNDHRRTKLLADFFIEKNSFQPHYYQYDGLMLNLPLEKSIQSMLSGQSWATIVPWSIFDEKDDNSSKLFSNESSQKINKNNTIESDQVSSTLSQSCQRWIETSERRRSSMFGVNLYIDQSNYLISHQMFYSFIKSIDDLVSDQKRLQQLFPADCQHLTSLMQRHKAFDIKEILYGSVKFRFIEFLLPGFLVLVVFAYSLVLTAFFFIREQTGSLERCLTAGTSGIEILVAYYLSQAILFIIQEAVLLMIVFKVFDMPTRGSLYAFWLLILILGLLGISFGLFVAVICPKPLSAGIFTSTVCIPGFFMSGVIWPIESMPPIFSYLSNCLPLTLPIDALRYIISRGPNMNNFRILIGFGIATSYITIVLILTLIIFKCKTFS